MHSALTDRGYWDEIWSGSDDAASAPPEIDVHRDPHQALLDRVLAARLPRGGRFVEVGAGGSVWPARMAWRGGEAWGIDFSRAGLGRTAKAAERAGVAVHLIEGDLFDERLLPAGAFDLVYSGGFVEHFADAAPLMRRLAALLAPGGVVVTTVPNLIGLNGLLQRLVDRECYARHVVFTPASLDRAHAAGGLVAVEPARYVGVLDLGSVNFARVAARLPAPALKALWAALSLGRRAGEALGARLGLAHGGPRWAPGLMGIYRHMSI
jgi:SAM-dependent methyltransferase